MSFRARVLAACYATLFGWACSSAAIEPNPSDGGTGSADGGRIADGSAAADANAAGDAATGACAPVSACSSPPCVDDHDATYGVDCAWSCGLPSPCKGAFFQQVGNGCSSSGCGPGTDASASYTVDATAAKCVITALRDGGSAHLEWGHGDNDIFNTRYQEAIDVVADRRAYVSYALQSDSPGQGRYAGRSLRPASYFQSCLDAGTAEAYLSCLEGAFDPACP